MLMLIRGVCWGGGHHCISHAGLSRNILAQVSIRLVDCSSGSCFWIFIAGGRATSHGREETGIHMSLTCTCGRSRYVNRKMECV